jgi:hypothetical protein
MSSSDLNNINPISGDANPVVGNSDASHVAIVVDLRAAISATANVAVFGPSEESVSNVIVCTERLPASTLYQDASNAMFEFWEPSDKRGEIRAQVATADRAALARANAFRDALHTVLQGALDASAANPFMEYKTASEYYRYTTFGELALSYAAEGMFGHPSAKVAITNDVPIVDGFNLADASAANVAVTANMDRQALAQRLAYQLLSSNTTTAQAITEVVLGQDARRATNEDNSALQVDRKAPLRFYADDVVYVKITLGSWTSSNGNAAAGFLNQAFSPATPPTQDYYLRITLS